MQFRVGQQASEFEDYHRGTEWARSKTKKRELLSVRGYHMHDNEANSATPNLQAKSPNPNYIANNIANYTANYIANYTANDIANYIANDIDNDIANDIASGTLDH